MKTTSSALLLAALLAIGPARAAPVAIGAPLQAATLDPLVGPGRTLASFRGKPLVINVWASWCGPCRAEMASLDRLARRYQGRFNVIGISTDDYRDRASAFLQQAQTSFPHYIDHDLQLELMLGADRIPLTLLVDARGRVLARHYGSQEWDSKENAKAVTRAFGM